MQHVEEARLGDQSGRPAFRESQGMKVFRFDTFQEQNMLRPVAWRWERAQHLVLNRQYLCRGRDDDVTCRAGLFLRGLARCGTDRQRAKLAQRMPDLHQAYEIHLAGGMRRLEIEARLLAGQGDDQIARLTGVSAAAVKAFEQLFFNVRDRLHASTYTCLAAVEKRHGGVVTGPAVEAFVRCVAYHGGPLVLDAVLAYLKARAATPDKPYDLSTEHGRLYQRVHLLLRLYTWQRQEIPTAGQPLETGDHGRRPAQAGIPEMVRQVPAVVANVDPDPQEIRSDDRAERVVVTAASHELHQTHVPICEAG